jgi:hypothetical protein
MKKIKAFLKNDIVERCYKTFFQAFIGTLITINVADIKTFDNVKTILISCIIAGVSAVWNIIKTLIDNKLNKEGK